MPNPTHANTCPDSGGYSEAKALAGLGNEALKTIGHSTKSVAVDPDITLLEVEHPKV